MKRTEYAIVDIETTGGNASGSRITEIAIIIHDGITVLDRFETLINPQKEIPLPIFALTGINNEMVRDAPIFDDVAQKVFSLLENRVFVAHNVNFDHTFVKHELKNSGFNWTAKYKLCTVRAARKIKPGFPSYSLGNLCKSLSINLENRHRAGGDANATAILLRQLLDSDEDGIIEKMIKKTSQDQRLPPNLPPEDFENLPEKPGIYYFYSKEKKVIYVGKANNLKKRVAQHFGGHKITSQRQNFLRDIHGISFEICGSELMALVMECCEIRKLWPIYNRALKKYEANFGLFQYEARNGYQYLAAGKLAKNQSNVLQNFYSLQESVNQLSKLMQDFNLDYRFCQFGIANDSLFKKFDSENLPDIKEHNKNVTAAVASLEENKVSFAVFDKGRTQDERSCIWVEKGHFYGMGYIPNDIGLQDISQIKDYVTIQKSNHYLMQLIHSFVKKNPKNVFFV
ncbi:GIY-YIG nuclease family protein [Flavobacterium sp. NST-5]|uniref:GIY-YIG nuclease family protein n=1 Tax=Flavobacterium ichthyis TaxID=2698827 RepID=A0ABW9ZGG3_9FLAO|nr:exonuclease domain-containing protein [Flavobacterium ichthyis]NBL65863.1 GIY-YIG nuclease family protein [Flavobacterium ichthyis]